MRHPIDAQYKLPLPCNRAHLEGGGGKIKYQHSNFQNSYEADIYFTVHRRCANLKELLLTTYGVYLHGMMQQTQKSWSVKYALGVTTATMWGGYKL